MRWSFALLAVVSGTIFAKAQSGSSALSTSTSQATPEPCAIVSSKASSYLSAHPKATNARLKPSDVYACFKSVPYDKQKDIDQIAWLKDNLQFQSTLAYLRNPPPSYPLPAVDIIAGLDNISTSIATGKYTNEYDIELDIYNLVQKSYDGHLYYNPYLVSTFRYFREVSLISVSFDGVQLPKLYFNSDIRKLSNASNDNFQFCAVTSIDGQDTENIQQYASGKQDLDALYNSALYNPTEVTSPVSGHGDFYSRAFTIHSDTTSFTFENGTTRVINATVEIPASIVENLPANGQDFFQKLITPSDSSSTSSPGSSSSSDSEDELPLPKTYPKPIVKHSENIVSGYFMDGTDSADVAVLSVNSFIGKGENFQAEFLQDTSTFLAKCKSTGKKRLIIDVRNNGGGSIVLGYLLFYQLFPELAPYTGLRFRGSDAARTLTQIASSNSSAEAEDYGRKSLFISRFNKAQVIQQSDGTNFTSWQQLYGPLQQHDDLYSNTFSFPWSTLDGIQTLSVAIYEETLPTNQVFSGDDITILSDGACASTCSDFVNLMIDQGHVKTVAVGGRPNKEPMAVIGGVQGGQAIEFEDLQVWAEEAINFQIEATGKSSTGFALIYKLLGRLALPPPIATTTKAAGGINFLDNIAEKDTTNTPLQFSGGIAADCRMFYMPADITSVSNTWARVAKGIKNGGTGLCINGELPEFTSARTTSRSTNEGSNVTGNGNSTVPFLGSASVAGPGSLGGIAVTAAVGSLVAILL